MKLWHRSRDQSGDTIVEVLIALAVISSVIVGAFFVVQKSTTAVRDSQEHGEVQQLLQGQVELVRSIALKADASDPIFSTNPKYFCIDMSNPATPKRQDFPSGFVLPDSAADDDYNGYPSVCKDIQTYYNIAISFDSSTNTFTAVGRWDRLNGGKDQETMAYRLYPNRKVVSAGTIAPPGAPDASFLTGLNPGGGPGGGPGPGGGNCTAKSGNNWNSPICWRITVVNTSVQTIPLAQCVWDFGDYDAPAAVDDKGAPAPYGRTTYPGGDAHCQSGKNFRYQYITRTPEPTKASFTIKLTNIGVNGLSQTLEQNIKRPY